MSTNLPSVLDFSKAGLSADVLARYRGISDDLSEGVGGGITVISIKGKVFRVRQGDSETPVTDPNTGGAMPYIDVIIIESNRNISKTYYKKAFKEGEDAAPDCMAIDGKVPDPGVPDRQSPTCAACRHNVYGSKITEQGTKTWACANSRRLAVVPANDPSGESYGGPALLRVPGGSLTNLKAYRDELKRQGGEYPLVVTRVGMRMDAAAPVLEFRAIRILTPDEFAAVDRMRKTGVAKSIVTSAIDEEVQAPEANPVTVRGDPPEPRVTAPPPGWDEDSGEFRTPAPAPDAKPQRKPRVQASQETPKPNGNGVGFGTPAVANAAFAGAGASKAQNERAEAAMKAPAPVPEAKVPVKAAPPEPFPATTEEDEEEEVADTEQDELIASVLGDLDD
jgi:hypothetical protein